MRALPIDTSTFCRFTSNREHVRTFLSVCFHVAAYSKRIRIVEAFDLSSALERCSAVSITLIPSFVRLARRFSDV